MPKVITTMAFTFNCAASCSQRQKSVAGFPLVFWLPVIPRLALVAFFPALGTSYFFSRACYWLPVSKRLALVASCAWQWPPFFPALGTGYFFPALGIGCLFSNGWYWLPVFPHLVLVPCFKALGTGGLFFPALSIGCLFPRAW